MHSHIFPDMVEEMKEKGFAYVDQGALVVDVKEETRHKRDSSMYASEIRRSFSLYNYRPCNNRRANETIQPG